MAYSDEALSFSQIPADHQVRLEDRVSFLYLERCSIRQDRTGVVAYSSEDGESIRRSLQIPVSSIAVLQLGPGTTISSAAMTSCTRAGATVLFTGGGGVPAYSRATPLTASARWAIAQAKLVASETNQRKAAVILYRRQLDLEMDAEVTSIAQMRGLEGRQMKLLYKQLSKKHRISDFRRDINSEDPVNQGLNLANSLLYGCAGAACAAIGVNPALGVIHRGDGRSLLFDLADLYKPSISIPLAFACAETDNPTERLRRAIRSEIHRQQLLKEMLNVLMEILSPHLPARDDDRLIAGRGDEAAGHIQYGKDKVR